MTTVANRNSPTFVPSPIDTYIGRPSKWGNPYSHVPSKFPGTVRVSSREASIDAYKLYLAAHPELRAQIGELRDKRLVCFCKPKACHGDVLAELANAL